MNRLVKKLSLLLAAAFVAVACGQKPNTPNVDLDQGVIAISNATPSVSNLGRVLPISFVAFGDWSVTSDAQWCTITDETKSGKVGDGIIYLNIEENPTEDASRTAILTIKVAGFPDQTLATITQSKTGGQQTGRPVNRWMADYMMSHYLWNGSFGVTESKLDYDVEPQRFLNDALSRMTGNEDDGGKYFSGERYYYSMLTEFAKPQSSQGLSRAARATTEGLGIQFVYPAASPVPGNSYLLVASVCPGSPAERAGIKRGQYITKRNGAAITSANLDLAYSEAMGYTPVSGQITYGISSYVEIEKNKYELQEQAPIKVTAGNYDKTTVVFRQVAEIVGKGTKIAYLVLSEFDASSDDDLLRVFDEFKAEGATELILDLRYNGGGDVYSSAVLGTLIAGSAYKGRVYSDMEFNEMRMKDGEKGVFYIGEHPSVGKYQYIIDALSRAMNIKTVYVIATNFTASASELVISGLRGLDLTVHHLGLTTEGKNVGMEVIDSKFHNDKGYEFGNFIYQFAPITFYNRNEKGFKDYGNGFDPIFEYDEVVDIMFDWKEGMMAKDMLFYAAFKHIQNGAWVSPNSAASTRGGERIVEVLKDHKVMEKTESRGTYIYPNSYYNN